MIDLDEDALICDLAETYGIYDYRQLPAQQVAVYAFGLKEDSRIKMALSNQTVPFETLLMASTLDRLSTLVWFKTKDGQKGANRPTMIAQKLVGEEKERDEMVFNSGEEFEAYRQRILDGLGGEK